MLSMHQCRLYLHWGPGHPQPNGAPRQRVFTKFPLQLIFAKVKAENQQHSLHSYLQLSQRSTRTALYCRSILLVFIRSCSSINNKVISLKKFISPQPVGGPSKRKKIRGPWARAQCAHWLRRPWRTPKCTHTKKSRNRRKSRIHNCYLVIYSCDVVFCLSLCRK